MSVAQDGRPLDLFRAETVQRRVLGLPSNQLNFSAWIVVWFMLAVFVTFIVLLMNGHYSRRVTAQGTLVPLMGSLRIVSDRPGLVVQVMASDGQRLRRGDSIISISGSPILENGKSLGDLLSDSSNKQVAAIVDDIQARSETAEITKLAYVSREKYLLKEIQNIQSSLNLQKEVVELTQSTLSAAEKLAEQKLISIVDLHGAREKSLQARQIEAGLARELDQAISSLNETRLGLRKLDPEIALQRSQSLVQKTIAEEKVANAMANRLVVLTSKLDGTVTGLRAKVGEQVVPGLTIGTVIPDNSRLIVEAWVPSSAIGFIRKGAKAKIMYDAFPYQTFGARSGTVLSADKTATDLSELPAQFRKNESLYRVLVEPDNQYVNAYQERKALTSGMKLAVDIELERRTLLQWILDPILAPARRL